MQISNCYTTNPHSYEILLDWIFVMEQVLQLDSVTAVWWNHGTSFITQWLNHAPFPSVKAPLTFTLAMRGTSLVCDMTASTVTTDMTYVHDAWILLPWQHTTSHQNKIFHSRWLKYMLNSVMTTQAIWTTQLRKPTQFSLVDLCGMRHNKLHKIY